jgi:hypothetical protein
MSANTVFLTALTLIANSRYASVTSRPNQPGEAPRVGLTSIFLGWNRPRWDPIGCLEVRTTLMAQPTVVAAVGANHHRTSR